MFQNAEIEFHASKYSWTYVRAKQIDRSSRTNPTCAFDLKRAKFVHTFRSAIFGTRHVSLSLWLRSSIYQTLYRDYNNNVTHTHMYMRHAVCTDLHSASAESTVYISIYCKCTLGAVLHIIG